MRPKEHCPRDDLPCCPDTDLDSAMEVDALKRVPAGLLWDDLRQDVPMLMLTGLTYEDALQLLRGVHQTDLAIRDFQSLSEDELLIIEICDRDVTSTFRIFGIKMKFSDKIQTIGFPDYEPHKHETKYLKDRWSMEAYPNAWESKIFDFVLPWVQMFEGCSKEFYFNHAHDLSKGILRGIKEYLESMEEHAEGWWYILHWFTISMEDDRAKEIYL
ncbi:hypothetical protein PHMEG_00019483 [Phytophthora megakarya]|uniref:Uncharacterized protein n=1 Tax=Phytophthora megakarya TaxID=4795 RepID=A0A225VSA0_9STRA|nr:hypothetical protein PHMEG_00019483 [Phytophthora megakarya]